MAEMDWAERGQLAREGLAPLRFLVGSWSGSGASQSQPVAATLEVRSILQDSVLEARERLFGADGALEHEDLTFYRYDPVARQLKVIQLMAHAWVTQALVQPEPDGCRWYAGPFAPAVWLRPQGEDGLVEEVWEPGAAAPALRLVYRRA